MRKVLFGITILGLILVPAVASAVSWIPIVPCGGATQVPCTPCSIFEAFKHIIDLVLYGITGPIAAFMIVYAGGMMLLGGGKPALYSEGKKYLTNTLIGVAIILLSWVVTNFLIKSLITGGQGNSWYEFSCPVGLSAIKPIETTIPPKSTPPPLPAPTILLPKYGGVATIGGGEAMGPGGLLLSCTSTKNAECPKDGRCPQFRSYLSKYSENAKLLEAIMFNESSCLIKPRPSGAGSFGLMQIQPATANANKTGCNVTGDITSSWLQSEQNVAEIICIANNYVNALKRSCGSDPLGIAAGYNGGQGACLTSRDCSGISSCVDGKTMRRWECPWDDAAHKIANTGYRETRRYAPKVAACAK